MKRPRTFPLPVALALALLAALLLFALFGAALAPADGGHFNLAARLLPPVGFGGERGHFLGTDVLGRDLVARLASGVRVSLLVALAGTLVGAIAGILVGLAATHLRGWVDQLLMMLVDIQSSLPFILIALTLLAFFGNSMLLAVGLMSLYGWEHYARITRGIVLSARAQPYAEAVVTLGASAWWLYRRHVFPNIASALIVQLTLTFPQIILLESALSFLGLGIQPPLVSLGQIMGDGRDSLSTAWWICVVPGTLILATTLAISIVGDWLRDRLDPTLRSSQAATPRPAQGG